MLIMLKGCLSNVYIILPVIIIACGKRSRGIKESGDVLVNHKDSRQFQNALCLSGQPGSRIDIGEISWTSSSFISFCFQSSLFIYVHLC